MHYLVLVPIGVAVGLVGALIGVGGGFFVVPFLLVFWRGFVPESATAASLGLVLLGALSATAANVRRRRIDYRTGLLLAAGTLPGAWLGREAIGRISSRAFSWSFGALLLGVAAYLVAARLRPGRGFLRGRPREFRDAEGGEHRYAVNVPVGLAVSLGVGLISSLFGIGGGLILVPFLVLGYGMPTILATAAAQFAFVFTAGVGVGAAVASGQMTEEGWRVVAAMGPGMVAGAQLGVAAARRVRERVVRGMIAAVLAAMGALMFFGG
ncbi:MAG TPA: sulfite exporter TauE/SafE family protein [Planctomycetota bacterium]|nr:sulfite exporter TauE/SafE family protein [Planctomycetota bacterium]